MINARSLERSLIMSYVIFFSNFLSYPKQINKRGKLSCMRAKLCNFLSNSLEQIDWVQLVR